MTGLCQACRADMGNTACNAALLDVRCGYGVYVWRAAAAHANLRSATPPRTSRFALAWPHRAAPTHTSTRARGTAASGHVSALRSINAKR